MLVGYLYRFWWGVLKDFPHKGQLGFFEPNSVKYLKIRAWQNGLTFLDRVIDNSCPVLSGWGGFV